MEDSPPGQVRFGPFEFDKSSGKLQRDGVRVPLQRKPAELLVLLVESGGKQLSRNQICDALWAEGDAIDLDQSLNAAVRKLRRALGDDAEEPRYVLTLPRHGYRFIAELEVSGGQRPVQADEVALIRPYVSARYVLGLTAIIGLILIAANAFRSHTTAASDGGRDRIESAVAVLPFANMSDDPEQAYFGDGLSQGIIDQLSGVQGLRVVARTSSFYFRKQPAPIRDVGKALGVSHVVEGSFQKDAENIRVSVALIEVSSGLEVWSRSFDRELHGVFEIQDEISLSVATAIGHRILESARPMPKTAVTDLSAYDLYLLARGKIDGRTVDGLRSARLYLESAISQDETYAPSRVAYAETLALLSDTLHTYGDIPLDEAYVLARPHIDRALELDPLQKEAHAVLGLFHYLRGEYELAEDALNQALVIDPNFSPAHIWLASVYGQTDELKRSLLHFETAYELSPLWPSAIYHYSRQLDAMGRTDEAFSVLERAESYYPDNPTIMRAEGSILWRRGRLADAVRRYDDAVAVDPDNRATLFNRAICHVLLHDFAEAEEYLTPALEPLYLWERGEPAAAADAAARFYTSNPARPEEIVELALWEGFAGREIRMIELLMPLIEEIEGRGGVLFSGRCDTAALLAHVLRNRGRVPEARTIISRIGRRVRHLEDAGFDGSDVAVMKAYQAAFEGDVDSVLKHLERAWDRGLKDAVLDKHPVFEFLDDDPRWREMKNRHVSAIDSERVKLELEPVKLVRHSRDQ